ncbi:MAG: YtxH domain-containing protein [Phaeospirillum sp.]|nr:YtxH domain-containing protein [Phaeospirillum sp.]
MAKKKRKKAKNGKRNDNWSATPARGDGQGGMLSGLTRLLPGQPSEQFLVGALIGAAVTYVLADEALRGKLIRSGLKLYSELAGGLAEMKEQAADIQAELAAGQG